MKPSTPGLEPLTEPIVRIPDRSVFEGAQSSSSWISERNTKMIAPTDDSALMRNQAAAVTIVAAGRLGMRAGLTVTSVCSLSDDPPTVLACIGCHSLAHDVIAASNCFSINILSNDQTDVRSALPDFMVPAHFVTMQSFPLTPNAKVDRKALPRPEEASRAKTTVEYIAPTNDLQVRLSDAFKRLLGVERVGAFDNFFTLGGHSLLAVRLHRDLKSNVAPELTITDIYRFPTVAGLAGHIQDRGQASKHLGQVADRAAARRQAMLGRRGTPEKTRGVS